MKKFILALISIVTVYTANSFAAGDFGLEVGLHNQSGDTDLNQSTTTQGGFQFGATAAFQVNGPLHFRTGMLYTNRHLKVSDTKYSLNYLDIPATLMYKFEDYAGVFAGVVASLNLDSSTNDSTKVTGVKSTLFPIVFGATFKFAPQMGATIYYESISGDVADHLKNFRAVGANLVMTFE